MTEFELIARIGQLANSLPRNGFEATGDDCTVLGIGNGESLLFTSDLLTEGIHFLRAATPPYELGRKALAVNLSDVAAMGGRAVATLLSLALPAAAQQIVYGNAKALAEERGDTVTTLHVERRTLNQLYLMGGADYRIESSANRSLSREYALNGAKA